MTITNDPYAGDEPDQRTIDAWLSSSPYHDLDEPQFSQDGESEGSWLDDDREECVF